MQLCLATKSRDKVARVCCVFDMGLTMLLTQCNTGCTLLMNCVITDPETHFNTIHSGIRLVDKQFSLTYMEVSSNQT